jgi:hypothetical protein
VPPDQKSPKLSKNKSGQPEHGGKSIPENLHEEGQQGNIYQNTRNQGYQQDR